MMLEFLGTTALEPTGMSLLQHIPLVRLGMRLAVWGTDVMAGIDC